MQFLRVASASLSTRWTASLGGVGVMVRVLDFLRLSCLQCCYLVRVSCHSFHVLHPVSSRACCLRPWISSFFPRIPASRVLMFMFICVRVRYLRSCIATTCHLPFLSVLQMMFQEIANLLTSELNDDGSPRLVCLCNIMWTSINEEYFCPRMQAADTRFGGTPNR